MVQLLKRGRSIAESGRVSGVFTAFEALAIGAACEAGSPMVIYRRLSQLYTLRSQQAAAMRSKLILPLFTLVVALIVQPLPALIGGSIGPLNYALHIALPGAALYALFRFARYAWHALADAKRPPSVLRLEALLRVLPGLGTLYRRSNLRDYFQYLGILLEAGIPMLSALPKAILLIRDSELREELSPLAPMIEQGSSFADAISTLSDVVASGARGLFYTGEESGTLPEMLERYAKLESESINLIVQQLSEWLPRVVYLLVCIYVAVSTISAYRGMLNA